CHTRDKDVLGAANLGYGDVFALQIKDRTHAFRTEQHKASNVHPRQDEKWVPRIQPDHNWPGEVPTHIGLTRANDLVGRDWGHFDVLYIGEPFALQQVFSQV